jgi:hypothetical protein
MACPDRIDETLYRVTLAIAVRTILLVGIDAIFHPSDEKTVIEKGEF